MARFDAIKCDRCRKVTDVAEGSVTQIQVGDKSLDLCNFCQRKLDDFLGGRELEVPP